MGGTKKKIPIEKIVKKDSRAVAFSKRRKGLYAKASELCLLSGAKMAILATPVSSKSNVSFFSFGHSSVDSVVNAFLAKKQPPQEEEEDDIMAGRGLGFWWEDESLAKSDDPEKLRAAINSISKTLQNLNKLRGDGEKLKKKKDANLEELEKTLNFESTSVNNIDHDQIVLISDNNGLPENLDGCHQIQEIDLDQMIEYERSFEKELEMELKKKGVETNEEMDQNKTLDPQLTSSTSHLCIQDDQVLPLSDYNNNNNNGLLDECNEEIDLDQMIDYVTNFEGLLMDFEMDDVSTTNQSHCEDAGAMVVNIQKDLEEDNLKFSDYFDALPSITAL